MNIFITIILFSITICACCNAKRNPVFIDVDNEKILQSFIIESTEKIDTVLVCITVDTMGSDTVVSFASVKYPLHLSRGIGDYEEFRYSYAVPMQILVSQQLVLNIDKFIYLRPDSKLRDQVIKDYQDRRYCNIRVHRKDYIISSNTLREVLKKE